MSEHHHVVDTTLECRDASGSPGRLTGVILPVGRVAADRAELFVGSGVQTPREGIRLLPEHRSSTVVMTFDPTRPWVGRSPMTLALATARVAGLLETATAGELNFVQQQLLTPRRGAGDYALTDTLAPDTIQKIVSAVAEHVGTGAFVIPADVTAQRLGPEPPDSFPLLRDRYESSILSLHGIPPALVQPGGTGTGAREAFRQVLHGLIKPLGLLLAEELQQKLDPDAALSFDALRAGDITGSARAFGSLTKAGLTPQSAAAVVGFDNNIVKEVPA